MIKPKIGICPDCGPDSKIEVPLIAGKCHRHYWQGRHKINQQKEKERSANNPLILVDQTALGLWFNYHVNHNTWICENCGDHILHYTTELAYSAQAHILPKKTFSSVKANLDNHLTLCAQLSNNNCHTAFDTSWERASRMPIFEVAKVKFLKFYHLLSEREMGLLPGVFQTLISQL